MLKFLLGLVVAILIFVVGVWYGYEKGEYNHVVFDAPGRIALYNAAKNSDNLKKMIENLIEQQQFFINDAKINV